MLLSSKNQNKTFILLHIFSITVIIVSFYFKETGSMTLTEVIKDFKFHCEFERNLSKKTMQFSSVGKFDSSIT